MNAKIYRKIECLASRWTDFVWDRRDLYFGGPKASPNEIERLSRYAEEDIHWGYGGPALVPHRGIEMPCPKRDCTVALLGGLAHEYGHVEQRVSGRLMLRWEGYPVSQSILYEEWDASVRGTRILLELDMWHPRHLLLWLMAWSGYAGRGVEEWAANRRRTLKQSALEKGIELYESIRETS